MKILITTSAFPVSTSDQLPLFILEQVIALKTLDESLEIHVLAPHNAFGERQQDTRRLDTHVEHRYHYCWPYSFHTLTGRGILPAIRQNPLRALLIPCFLIFQKRALFKLCRSIKPTIIYSHWFTPQAIVSASVSRKLGIPMIFTTHASDVSILKRIPFSKRLISSVLAQASAYTAVSQRTANKLRSVFSEKEWESRYADKLSIIPMGTHQSNWTQAQLTEAIDNKSIDSTANQQTTKIDRKSILAIGRLAHKKGFHYLIEAYAAMDADFHNRYKLTIAGSGPLEQSLRKRVTTLKMDEHIFLPGHVHTDKKHGLLKEASLFVLPSIIDETGDSEGLPVSLLEALAYGKIIIATNVSGAEEIIDDSCGILVDQKSKTSICHAFNQFLNMEKPQRTNIEQQAKRLSSNYSWPIVARQQLDVLNRASDTTMLEQR